jgi:hypothetical protein
MRDWKLVLINADSNRTPPKRFLEPSSERNEAKLLQLLIRILERAHLRDFAPVYVKDINPQQREPPTAERSALKVSEACTTTRKAAYHRIAFGDPLLGNVVQVGKRLCGPSGKTVSSDQRCAM